MNYSFVNLSPERVAIARCLLIAYRRGLYLRLAKDESRSNHDERTLQRQDSFVAPQQTLSAGTAVAAGLPHSVPVSIAI
jgi:hypothetical protein